MPLTTYVAGDVLTAASLNDNFTFAAGSSGVVQVISTTKTDQFSSNSTTFTDITGLSVSITPTSTSNKILVVVYANLACNTAATEGQALLLRDSTEICIGDADGVKTRSTASFGSPATVVMQAVTISFLDSPATTSAITYKLQGRSTISAQFFLCNRSVTNPNSPAIPVLASTITVFEVTP